MPHALVIIHDIDPDAVVAALARVTASVGSLPIVVQTLTPEAPHDWCCALEAILKARGLNAKECALVRLDQEGLSRSAIAEQLGLSPTSITAYWKLIYSKLDFADRAALRQWLGSLRLQIERGVDKACLVGE